MVNYVPLTLSLTTNVLEHYYLGDEFIQNQRRVTGNSSYIWASMTGG